MKGVILITNNKPPKDEHDHSYKDLLSKKDTFLHFLKKYIGASWANEIKEDDLILMNTSFILKDYNDIESDIIYRAKLRGKDVIFYVLLELQSTVDFTMPFRLLIYITELLRRVFLNADENKRERKNFRLPAVIPIVLYNGSDKWTAVKTFKEYLDNYELFGNNVIDFEYLLLDLNHSSEEFILSTNKLLDNIFALDQKQKAEEIIRIINIVLHRFNDMQHHEQVEFMNWFKQILLLRIPEGDRFEILESIEGGEKSVLKYGWDIAFENERKEGIKEGIEKGIEKGIKEGIEKGRKDSKIEIAEKFLKIGLTVEQVMQGTELPEEEVIKIKTQLKI